MISIWVIHLKTRKRAIKCVLPKAFLAIFLNSLSRTFFANFCAREYAQRIDRLVQVGVNDLNVREWTIEIAISQRAGALDLLRDQGFAAPLIYVYTVG